MTDQVRAKFKVHNVVPNDTGGGNVSLGAVVGPGNESWAAASPSGNLSMHIANPAAFAFFKLGEEVYIDFSSANPGASMEDMGLVAADEAGAIARSQ